MKANCETYEIRFDALTAFRRSSFMGILSLMTVLTFFSERALLADEHVPSKSHQEDSVSIQVLESVHFPLSLQVGDRILVGGTPNTDETFRKLAQRGVRTIVSVDQASPSVEAAKTHGMRYVHLPVGYAGLTEDRIHAVAALLRHEDGGIYVHCHHGRHRAPAATAAACVSAGILDHEKARKMLEAAGTSPRYSGLFAAVDAARRVPKEVLSVDRYEYPERASVPLTATRMVQLGRLLERLSDRELGQTERAHHSVLIEEQLQELLRLDEVKHADPDYRKRMTHSLQHAVSLRELGGDHEHFQIRLDRLRQSCTSCHLRHRDR